MKLPLRSTLFALLAAGWLGSAAAQSALPAPPTAPANGTAPSDGIQIDADEMAAIEQARERCRGAGAARQQQACMNQAQIEYYRQRDAAGGKGEASDPPARSDGEAPRPGPGSDRGSEPQAL